MPPPRSFFQVYGPEDPALAEQRLRICRAIPPGPDYLARLEEAGFYRGYHCEMIQEVPQPEFNCVMVAPLRRALGREPEPDRRTAYERQVATISRAAVQLMRAIEESNGKKIVFEGEKCRKVWYSNTPVVAAVDWSPPPIKTGCRFQKTFRLPLLNSFA